MGGACQEVEFGTTITFVPQFSIQVNREGHYGSFHRYSMLQRDREHK